MSCPHCGDPTGVRCCEFGADRGPDPSPAPAPAQPTGILLTAHERVITHAALIALVEVWEAATQAFNVAPLAYENQIRELIEKLA